MIANAARIDGLVRSVDEAVRAGRTEDATAAATVLQKALHKQVAFHTFH
jgi:ribosomal protein S20